MDIESFNLTAVVMLFSAIVLVKKNRILPFLTPLAVRIGLKQTGLMHSRIANLDLPLPLHCCLATA